MNSLHRLPIRLIVDNVRSLLNVGALFRLADGAGIEEIVLCGITGYPSLGERDTRFEWVSTKADKMIRKTGLEAVDAMPFRYVASTVEAIDWCKNDGYQVVSLELSENAADYREIEYHFPVALVVGHETDGVSEAVIQLSAAVAKLPMAGVGKSLNVSTATGVMLYCLSDRYMSKIS